MLLMLIASIPLLIMDAVEDYDRKWIKIEVDQDPELESLSDWFRTIRSQVQGRIQKIYDFKIEVVPFIINVSTDLTTVVKF
jgi:hypothetical protein